MAPLLQVMRLNIWPWHQTKECGGRSYHQIYLTVAAKERHHNQTIFVESTGDQSGWSERTEISDFNYITASEFRVIFASTPSFEYAIWSCLLVAQNEARNNVWLQFSPRHLLPFPKPNWNGDGRLGGFSTVHQHQQLWQHSGYCISKFTSIHITPVLHLRYDPVRYIQTQWGITFCKWK